MAFWGPILKPNQKKKVESPEGDILHLSQACLNDPKDGKNYVMAEVSGTSYAIACLEKGKKEHDSFDLFFDPAACSFTNKGQSEVHLTGYFEPVDDEGDEEEATPAKAKDKKLVSLKVEPAKASPKVEAKKSPKVEPAKSPKSEPAKAVVGKGKEPEGSEDEEDEEGEEEELPEEEEEESEAPPSPAKAGNKRKGGAEAEPPAKKGKLEAKETKAAAGTPAKPAADPIDAYVSELQKFLKANGKTNIGQLGSKLPKPKEVPKFKVIWEKHKDKFVVTGDQVDLKK